MHNIKRNKSNKKATSVGRGGKRGKTSGRGTKGQNARSGRKKRPEMRDIIKRYPKLRGRGKNYLKSIQGKAIAISTTKLNESFALGDTVSVQTLLDKKIINNVSGKAPEVKIVLGKEVDKKLSIVGIKTSATAKASIEKAGGNIA